MVKIVYPHHPFRIKTEDNRDFIFDEIRRQWVRLSPEEWVRQNFIQYLVQTKGYPAALMAIEKEIRLHELRKRCDIILYKDTNPWMIVECKEMQVPLDGSVLAQVLRYNLSIPSLYIVITNGGETLCWKLHNGVATELQELPDWQ